MSTSNLSNLFELHYQVNKLDLERSSSEKSQEEKIPRLETEHSVLEQRLVKNFIFKKNGVENLTSIDINDLVGGLSSANNLLQVKKQRLNIFRKMVKSLTLDFSKSVRNAKFRTLLLLIGQKRKLAK